MTSLKGFVHERHSEVVGWLSSQCLYWFRLKDHYKKKMKVEKKKGSECLKSVPRIPAPHEWHTHARFTFTLAVLGYSTTTTGKGLGQTRDSAELPFKECSGIKNKTNRNKTKQKNPNQNPLPSLWGFYTVFFLTTITSHASYTNKKS